MSETEFGKNHVTLTAAAWNFSPLSRFIEPCNSIIDDDSIHKFLNRTWWSLNSRLECILKFSKTDFKSILRLCSVSRAFENTLGYCYCSILVMSVIGVLLVWYQWKLPKVKDSLIFPLLMRLVEFLWENKRIVAY